VNLYEFTYGLCGCAAVRQCAAVRAAVCGSAHSSMRAVRAAVYGSALGSPAVRQSGSPATGSAAVCGSALGSVRQCGSACVAVRQSSVLFRERSVHFRERMTLLFYRE
jgi:hypothetical protein